MLSEKVKLRIEVYLSSALVMQLATVGEDRPWICSVYFVADAELNLYWLSLPTRRHSIEISTNNNVAVTIAVKQDLPVIGLGGEGTVELVKESAVVQKIIKKYIAKYSEGHAFYDKFIAGTNDHVMYKFTPKKYVLFDEINFPKDMSIDFLLSN